MYVISAMRFGFVTLLLVNIRAQQGNRLLWCVMKLFPSQRCSHAARRQRSETQTTKALKKRTSAIAG